MTGMFLAAYDVLLMRAVPESAEFEGTDEGGAEKNWCLVKTAVRLSALYTRSSTAAPGGQRCKHPTNPAALDTHLLFLLKSARVQDDAAQIDFTE